MAEKKSTADILAQLRKEAGKKPADEAATTASSAAEPSADAGASTDSAQVKPGKAAAPKSTSDILAALRAETKSGGGQSKSAAKTSSKPGSAEPAKAEAVEAKAPVSTKGLSVAEMVRAARGEATASEDAGAPATTTAATDEPAKPVRKKPAAIGKAKRGKADAEEQTTRRNWLVGLLQAPFVLAWIAFSVAGGAFLLGMARFLMPNVLIEPPSSFKIGTPGDFPPDTVSSRFKAEFGVWIVNTLYDGKRMVYALRSVCTHLGCTPNWLEGEQKFKCPCHGSGFYINGVNFEGPAPRPLERVGIKLGADGLLEVDKSMKFQQEMGQWEDDASYVEVA